MYMKYQKNISHGSIHCYRFEDITELILMHFNLSAVVS